VTTRRSPSPAKALTHPFVMAGLVPAIHVFDLFVFPRRGCPAQGRA
jgi:hypothetical protein